MLVLPEAVVLFPVPGLGTLAVILTLALSLLVGSRVSLCSCVDGTA